MDDNSHFGGYRFVVGFLDGLTERKESIFRIYSELLLFFILKK